MPSTPTTPTGVTVTATSPLVKSKKRKSPDLQPCVVQCTRCSFSASSIDQSLTHLRENHNGSAKNHRMVLAVDTGKLLMQHAIANASDTNIAFLEELQQQYTVAAKLLTSLYQHKGEDDLSSALTQLIKDDTNALITLRDASAALLKNKQTTTTEKSSSLSPAEEATTTQGDGGDHDGRSSIHEEEAAQALTGLRRLSSPELPDTGVTATTEVTITDASAVAAPRLTIEPPAFPSSSMEFSVPQPSPFARGPMGMMGSPLSITAPPVPTIPGMTSPHFPHPSPMAGGSTPMGTPSSLPSLFSRGLLVPITSPTAEQLAGLYSRAMTVNTPSVSINTPSINGTSNGMLGLNNGQLTPLGEWKEHHSSSSAPSGDMGTTVVVTNSAPVPSSIHPPTKMEVTSHTPVTAFYRPETSMNGQTSPVKRKSITSKQLAVTTHANGEATTALTIGAKVFPIVDRVHSSRKANPRRWTKEEDDALRKAVESHREKNWKAIAAHVPGRNHTQCLQRWTKVLAPGLVKGHWSPQEDELLRKLVANEQKNWGDVAAKIPGRTSKQCRERWHNHLDPNIVRGTYTPEEDRIILEAQARLGNRWSVIAAMLPGRTEDAVKIRWKSHCRLWRARKYLRKSPGDVNTNIEPVDDNNSEPQTPQTPLIPTPMADASLRMYAWPTAPALSPTNAPPASVSNGATSVEMRGGGAAAQQTNSTG